MADFISFREGRKKLASDGLPATCKFALSTKDCNTHLSSDTYAGGFGEIAGTGYARQTEAEPVPSLADPSVIAFAQKTWATGAAADWPASVKSVVQIDDSGGVGQERITCAFNLVAGGAARAMNAANVTENFTPTLNLA